MDFHSLSINQIKSLISDSKLTCVEIAQFYLDNIEKYNPEYNVFLQKISPEKVLEQAKQADAKYKDNSARELEGIPFVVKDSYLVEGTTTTAGDLYLQDTPSRFTSEAVQFLLDEGAILLGKVNMDSWGFGGSTENSSYGPTKNPFDSTRVAGGSSGGSAAAVALKMAKFALAEDTGGSIRNPASFCGVYGLKPTNGVVSRYGCIAYASSLDTVGPITNHIMDVEALFNVIRRRSNHDMTTESISESTSLKTPNKRFLYSLDFISEGIDPEIKETYLEEIEKFKNKGYEAVQISLKNLNVAVPTYYITAMSEASTNLSRYNGTRYGNFYQNKLSTISNWKELYTNSRTEGFSKEAKRRIILGSNILSEGHYDAYYKKAAKIRGLMQKELNDALENADFLLSPVTPNLAPKIGEMDSDPLKEYLADIYTVTANLCRVPALAYPAKKSKGGLAIGMQIVGVRFSDDYLINILKN